MKTQKLTKNEEPAKDLSVNALSQQQEDTRYIPIRSELLPSLGKTYANGISARPMSVVEIKLLATMNEENSGSIIDRVISSCVKGVKFEQILSADKMFLIFWLRVNTFKNSDYHIQFDCPHCKASRVEHIFRVADLNIKQQENEIPSFTTESGDVITFRHTTAGDETYRKVFNKQNEKTLMEFIPEILDVAEKVATINGETKGLLEKYIFLTNGNKVSPDDYLEIEEILAEHGIGLSPLITVVCPKCKEGSESPIPFRPEFFVSKGRNK